jgi:hypothetical protein
MEREGAGSSLHRRLMEIIDRGARAQEHSQLLVEAHEYVDAQVRATVAAVQARRAQSRAAVEHPGRSQSDR